MAVDPFGAGSGFLPVDDFIVRVENSIAEYAEVQFSINPSLASQTVTGRISIDEIGMPDSDGPYVAIEGNSVTLNASASSDPGGNIVPYE